MIPKKIHHIWLSGDEKPELFKQCIASWHQAMPDFQIKCWTLADIDSNELGLFFQEACHLKKWAFASDYLRIWILNREGGIYFDSDVMAKCSLLPLSNCGFFTSVEYHPSIVEAHESLQMLDTNGLRKDTSYYIPGVGLQAAIMGSIPSHPFLHSCLEYYDTQKFILPNGTLNQDPIAPTIYAVAAEKYGFRWVDTMQTLDHNMVIYPSAILAGTSDQELPETYAVHQCAGTWRTKSLPPSPPPCLLSRGRSIFKNWLKSLKPIFRR
jgi:Glycosyltransferase sugar-binding region containing DXD motif